MAPPPRKPGCVPTHLIGLCFHCFSEDHVARRCSNPSCCFRCQEPSHQAHECSRPRLLLGDRREGEVTVCLVRRGSAPHSLGHEMLGWFLIGALPFSGCLPPPRARGGSSRYMPITIGFFLVAFFIGVLPSLPQSDSSWSRSSPKVLPSLPSSSPPLGALTRRSCGGDMCAWGPNKPPHRWSYVCCTAPMRWWLRSRS
jgi:hypothetical protein